MQKSFMEIAQRQGNPNTLTKDEFAEALEGVERSTGRACAHGPLKVLLDGPNGPGLPDLSGFLIANPQCPPPPTSHADNLPALKVRLQCSPFFIQAPVSLNDR